MASRKRETCQTEPRTYMLFMFQMDDEWKTVGKLFLMIKEIRSTFLAATVVGWTETSQLRT